MNQDAVSWRRPALILFSGFVFFLLAGYRDLAWTLPMFEKPWAHFTDVMSRSLFEGEAPGVSDLGVILPIVSFGFWLKHRRTSSLIMNRRLMHFKFIFMSGLLAPLAVVQTCKILVSRARPKAFLREMANDPTLFDPHAWAPGFMGWTGPRGSPWNSFPSGHASVCAIMLVFVYILGTTKIRKTAVFMIVTGLTALMAIARAMAGMHWLSDSVASFFIVWAVIDVLWSRMPELRSKS